MFLYSNQIIYLEIFLCVNLQGSELILHCYKEQMHNIGTLLNRLYCSSSSSDEDNTNGVNDNKKI